MMLTLRLALPEDAEALLAIYAPYVSGTAVSFETAVPSVVDFAQRIAETSLHFPYLVALDGDAPVGYAYASRHRQREAYRYDVETSIYVAPAHHGTGVANKLYGCLFGILTELGYYNAYAACTLPNAKSMGFHARQGFDIIGVHHKTGYKLSSWHDVAWMEKVLRPHDDAPAAVKSISELTAERLVALLSRSSPCWPGTPCTAVDIPPTPRHSPRS